MTDREQTVEDLVTFTLKKCPFCGSDAVMEFFSTALEKKPRFRVRCSSCWCQTDITAKTVAISRAELKPTRAALAIRLFNVFYGCKSREGRLSSSAVFDVLDGYSFPDGFAVSLNQNRNLRREIIRRVLKHDSSQDHTF